MRAVRSATLAWLAAALPGCAERTQSSAASAAARQAVTRSAELRAVGRGALCDDARTLGACERIADRRPLLAADGGMGGVDGSGCSRKPCEAGMGAADTLGPIARVGVPHAGAGQPNGPSYNWRAATTATASLVVFESDASNLIAGDSNGARDVFVYEPATGALARVSVSSTGVQGNRRSAYGVVSADGRYVAYHSAASNLVSADTNAVLDVFVHDRMAKTTERVSVSSAAQQGDGDSVWPVLSADGRYVAFLSAASNLSADDTNGKQDVFVRDRQTGVTERVSVSSSGAQADDAADLPDLSADGRYVVFPSRATNLVAADRNRHQDVFIRDRRTGTTQRVSVATSGAEANADSYRPVISADGRYVAFTSAATNLAGNANGVQAVFIRDLRKGQTRLASVAWNGTVADGSSYEPAISGDGRYVVFYTYATTLLADDTNGVVDLVVYDALTGLSAAVSMAADGGGSNGHSFRPDISADGRRILFSSSATNLVAGDTNALDEVFSAPNPLW